MWFDTSFKGRDVFLSIVEKFFKVWVKNRNKLDLKDLIFQFQTFNI